jgi:phosphatidylglycerol---prolipoprotein diacylglyceryl transferase
VGIRTSTGDLFVFPIALGTIIGRVGCFLEGLADNTYGTPTSLPWGIDFGDGIRRHPTQLYDIAWVAALTAGLLWFQRRPHRPGDLFKGYMVGYLGWRFLIDFLKPGIFLFGLTTIQWVCLATLLYYAKDLPFLIGMKEAPAHA